MIQAHPESHIKPSTSTSRNIVYPAPRTFVAPTISMLSDRPGPRPAPPCNEVQNATNESFCLRISILHHKNAVPIPSSLCMIIIKLLLAFLPPDKTEDSENRGLLKLVS